MSNTKQYVCAKCGTTFVAKVADRKRGWARHCSKSCAAWSREKKLDRDGYFGRPSERLGEHEFNNAHLFSNEEHDCNKE